MAVMIFVARATEAYRGSLGFGHKGKVKNDGVVAYHVRAREGRMLLLAHMKCVAIGAVKGAL